jgi:hypothetical protein
MSSGTAITLTGTAYDKTFGGVMGGLAHLHIVGPAITSNVDGILFTGDNTASPSNPFGSARSVLSNCAIEKFKFGVTFYNRAYLATLQNCEVFRCRVGIYSKAGAVDAYENVGIQRGAIYNNQMNIYVEDGHVFLQGTSVDYATVVQMAVKFGTLYLRDCHVEYAISETTYGGAGGIYTGNAPLTAIDLYPAGISTLDATIGLTSTSPTTSTNGTTFKMDGGFWAVTAPRHTSNGLVAHISIVDNQVCYLTGNIKMYHQVNVPTSGYMACKFTAYNTVDIANFAGVVEFTPTHWGIDEIPHIAHRGGSGAYMTTNPLVGYSISPAHNLSGWFNLSSGSFEAANLLEDCCITGDTAAITDRQTGTNGSFVRSSADGSFSGGTGSFKMTKVGAAGTTFKVAFLYPRLNNYTQRRPVVRMAMSKPSSGGATTGSFNINVKFIKPEYLTVGALGSESIFRPVQGTEVHPGGVATGASGTSAQNPTVYRSTGGSAYCDVTGLTAGTWYPVQIAENVDRSLPAWATHVMLEFDLTNLGAGTLLMDGLDIQWM